MKCIKLALPVLLLCNAFPAWATDLAGVQLGSTLAEAKAGMSRANPALKFSPIKLTSGKEVGVVGKTSDRMPGTGTLDSGGPSDEFVALQGDRGNVYFMARTQRLPAGSRIRKDVLEKSLKEKFGKASYASPSPFMLNNVSLIQEYDRQGKLYVGPAGKGPCAGVGWDRSDIPGATIAAPSSYSATCGMLIEASGLIHSDNLIPSYTVKILDVKSIYDELNGKAIASKAEQEKRLQQEQAKGVKPQL